MKPEHVVYRGRIAPSPTGFLHLGHARTFWTAQLRARSMGGVLILRNEDLDRARCRPEFVAGMLEDLRWFGFEWAEGPDVGGPVGPYNQSERLGLYRSALATLASSGWVYPCRCSRQDVQRAARAPHAGEEEPIYPGFCRPSEPCAFDIESVERETPGRVNWRFRCPEPREVVFEDGGFGVQSRVVGRDFGDFVAWRGDGFPSYQLAVVVDDHQMGVTEVVRGADLLTSTARQWLIYEAFGWKPPAFFHCPLVLDEQGQRLAKRHAALSLRALREQGATPSQLRTTRGFEGGVRMLGLGWAFVGLLRVGVEAW